MAYSKSAPLAQDIVQDVFLKIWEKRETLPDIQNFEDYLFIMARNRIISEFRKNLSRPVDISRHDALEGNIPLPDEQLSFKQSQELVNKAVDLLPAQRKIVFQLSRTEGLSYGQIAEKLGISKNTVKEHIVKALSFLRTYLYTRSYIPLLGTSLLLFHLQTLFLGGTTLFFWLCVFN